MYPEIINLVKTHPNDADLGAAVRNRVFTMTKYDRNIMELCVGVIKSRLQKERRLYQRYHLQVTLSRLEEMLKEPDTDIPYDGEFWTTSNWFDV